MSREDAQRLLRNDRERAARGARVIAAGSDATDAPEPYLRAGADLILLGEGLETLMAVVPRLDANPTTRWRA